MCLILLTHELWVPGFERMIQCHFEERILHKRGLEWCLTERLSPELKELDRLFFQGI